MRNKLVLTGLAAALTVSVVSALSTSEANQTLEVEKPAPETVREQDASIETSDEADVSEEVQDADVVKVGDSQPKGAVSNKPAIAKIHAYEKSGRPAATLYVRNIPVVTFLGTEKSAETEKVATTKSETAQPEANQQDPVWRATTIAAKINQLDRDGVDANNIKVIWDKERESYVIKTSDAHILEMSELTILPKNYQGYGR